MTNTHRGLFRGFASTTGPQRGPLPPWGSKRLLPAPQVPAPSTERCTPTPTPFRTPIPGRTCLPTCSVWGLCKESHRLCWAAGALGWVQLPQAWCLDLDPAEPVVRGVACELTWPGRKPQTQTMLGLTSGYRPGPHRLGDPDRPPCPVGMGQLSLPHPNMRQLQWVDPTDPGRLTTKARDQIPACVGHLNGGAGGQWDTPEGPRSQPH